MGVNYEYLMERKTAEVDQFRHGNLGGHTQILNHRIKVKILVSKLVRLRVVDFGRGSTFRKTVPGMHCLKKLSYDDDWIKEVENAQEEANKTGPTPI